MRVVLFGAPVAGFADEIGARVSGAEVVVVGYDAAPDALAAALSGARAVVAVRWTAGLPPAPALRLVQVPGVGCDEIDLSALLPGVTLCNVHGHEVAVAEYVVGMLIGRYHRLWQAAESFRAGSWTHSSRLGAAPHEELAGRTVGIVGFGRIGRALSRRLAALDVTVLAANRSPVAGAPEVARAYPLAGLKDMLAASDAVVLAVALSEETVGLIGRDELAAMRPDAIVVNVARGPVVEEDALYDALAEGRIGGAILDVWYGYPSGPLDAAAAPARRDFRALPNVVATPHVSGWTRGTVERRLSEIAENLARLRDGRPLINVVRAATAP